MNTVLESDVIARSSATKQSRADLYRPALDDLMLSLSKYEVVALALRQAQAEGSDRQAVIAGGRNETGQPRIKSAYDVMELGTVIARSSATKQSSLRIPSALDCFTLRVRNDSVLPGQVQSARKTSEI